jgi:hypothetical protein
MRRFLIAALALVGLGLLTTPALAFNSPACGGDFLIFAKEGILMEQGPTNITGNIMNLSLANTNAGTIFVGAHNVIKGTVSANKIVLGTGAKVDVCEANIIQNNSGTTNPCGNIANLPNGQSAGPGFSPTPACVASFPSSPAFPAACVPGTAIIVPKDTAQTLAPGCYASIRLNGGTAKLDLQAGQDYQVKGELRLLLGSTLESDTPGTSANVIVKGALITEPQTFLTDLNLFDLSGPTNNVHFGNGTILDNVLAVSSTGEIHIHTGSQLRGTSELVARALQVQPITNIPPPVELQCTCLVGVPKPGADLFQCVLP